MKRKLSLIFIALLLFGLAACATMNAQLTPKQVATWMNTIYAAQYDEYLTWFNKIDQDENNKFVYQLKENVSDKQIKILEAKRKILVELEPLLKQYTAYVQTGQTGPAVDVLSQRAIALVQQLIDMEE